MDLGSVKHILTCTEHYVLDAVELFVETKNEQLIFETSASLTHSVGILHIRAFPSILSLTTHPFTQLRCLEVVSHTHPGNSSSLSLSAGSAAQLPLHSLRYRRYSRTAARVQANPHSSTTQHRNSSRRRRSATAKRAPPLKSKSSQSHVLRSGSVRPVVLVVHISLSYPILSIHASSLSFYENHTSLFSSHAESTLPRHGFEDCWDVINDFADEIY